MLGGEKKKVGSSGIMDAYHEIALNSGDLLKDDPSELVHATLAHLQEDEDAEVRQPTRAPLPHWGIGPGFGDRGRFASCRKAAAGLSFCDMRWSLG